MIMVLDDQLALTPAGKPLTPDTPEFEMPVAPVVVCEMLVSTELMHKLGKDDAAPAVVAVVTVIDPVAFTLPQPPVNGIL